MTSKVEGPKSKVMRRFRHWTLDFGLWTGALAFLPSVSHATAAESYNPIWAGELGWTSGNLFNRASGATAWLEDQYVPWWQNQVAHPVDDYSASKLATGGVRLDTAVDVDYTIHRLLPGWSAASSPSKINNVYTFTPGGRITRTVRREVAKAPSSTWVFIRWNIGLATSARSLSVTTTSGSGSQSTMNTACTTTIIKPKLSGGN